MRKSEPPDESGSAEPDEEPGARPRGRSAHFAGSPVAQARTRGRLVLRGLVVAGLLLAGGGVWLLTTDSAGREATRVAALPRTDPAGLARFAPGAVVLLEGRLAPAGAGHADAPGFLAYFKERYLRTETSGANAGREQWTRVETVTPSVAITAGAAVVPVVNRDYGLRQPPQRWQSEVRPRYVSVVDTTERWIGFKAADLVTCEATVVAGAGETGGTPGIRAVALFGGDTAAYVADVRGGVVVLKVVGGVFLGLGLILAAVGGCWLRWIRRRVPAAR